jgi:hypothetical protein
MLSCKSKTSELQRINLLFCRAKSEFIFHIIIDLSDEAEIKL